MEKFYSYIRNSKIFRKLPKRSEINSVFSSFSRKEWIVFIGLLSVLLLSTIAILQSINKSFMVRVPLRGGSISIGIVGVPRFINPILASSEADQNLIALIYSGLMRKSEDGTLIPDLAEKYEMSEDGLSYIFTLRENVYFHDGKPVTPEDVIFTINKIKDATIKSPRKADWDGVSAEKIDEKNIKFILKQPYASFLKNTTIGIMPAHLWDNSPIELNDANTSPIGSGPYMMNEVNKQSRGVIDYLRLASFKKFALGAPFIKNMNLRFYQNEEDMTSALLKREVEEISGVTPGNAEILKEKGYQIESAVLPRIFGLFLNQSANRIFIDKAVTNAINQAIDKERIVRDVLSGYGTVIDGPIPPNIIKSENQDEGKNREEIILKVKNDLAKAGWKEGADRFLEKTTIDKKTKVVTPLTFSISTGNAPELAKTAERIQEDLAEVGFKVEIKTFETGNLNQNVIRPRKYDAFLFGEIINNESDLFAFWHSSQRKDPGLNVAMYTNAKVDKILEEAFITVDEKTRTEKYIQFRDEVKKDLGAIFLYSPDFIYVMSKNIREPKMENIISSSDRYLNAYSWYSQTENIWKIFTK
ncbi:peptide ABC transporter substrate-binding protein [Candidatus Nomurabacteria bacterium]|nr:peptide ABC transporter substrate-binding protein [Candidatus Nomurabacteria bacterium]